jgi:hypothetical protein
MPIPISVPNPDSPVTEVPIYEGPDADAFVRLSPGVYAAADEDGMEGTLLVSPIGASFHYASCSMLGCPVLPVPHNHPAWAL